MCLNWNILKRKKENSYYNFNIIKFICKSWKLILFFSTVMICQFFFRQTDFHSFIPFFDATRPKRNRNPFKNKIICMKKDNIKMSSSVLYCNKKNSAIYFTTIRCNLKNFSIYFLLCIVYFFVKLFFIVWLFMCDRSDV